MSDKKRVNLVDVLWEAQPFWVMVDRDIFQERLLKCVDRFAAMYNREATAMALAKSVRIVIGMWRSDRAVGEALMMLVTYQRSELNVLADLAGRLMEEDVH